MKKKCLVGLALFFVLLGNATAQTTGYVVKNESADVYSVDLKSPAQTERSVASMGDVMMADALLAGDMVGTDYVVLRYSGMEDVNYLSKLDLETGKYSDVGTPDSEYTDMAYDAANQTMYAVKGNSLYTVDLSTAQETKVEKTFEGTLRGIAVGSDGLLYTLNKNSEGKFTLNTIDPQEKYEYNELFELQLEGGLKSVNTRQSLDFNDEGVLYWLADLQKAGSYSFTYHTAAIDITDGTVTLLSDLSTRYAGLAMADMDGGEEPEPDPEKVQRVKYSYLMGDAMGEGTGATKMTESFYGPENQLLRALEQSQNLATKEFEPYTYTKYVTTVDDAGNKTVAQSMRKKVAGGGSLSDLDRYWQEYDSIDVTVYDAQGRMSSYTKVGNTRTEYAYEGDNLVSEVEVFCTGGSMNGKTRTKKFYSDFVEGKVNCPKYVLVGVRTQASVTELEYEYDEFGNKTQCITYTTTDAIADEDGVYWAEAVKGDPKQKETWTYDNEGRLTEYVKIVKYKNEEWAADYNNRKTAYEYDNDTTYIRSFTGDGVNLDGWYESPAYTKEVNGTFHGDLALKEFAVQPKDGSSGVYLLTANAPEISVGDYLYKVYRDGEEVGEMTPNAETGMMEFEDKKVGKGIHDWFVMTYDNMNEISMNISDAVELETDILLNPVTDIKVVKNEVFEGRAYITVEWVAPVSDGAVLQGYNFYTDVVNINNSVPVNTELIAENTYSYDWDAEGMDENTTKDFWVEAVYDLGKVKSEKQIVKLAIPVGIDELSAIVKLMISDNMVIVDGECGEMRVCNINGVCVEQASGNKMDISGLSSGVYILTVKTGNKVYSVKFYK